MTCVAFKNFYEADSAEVAEAYRTILRADLAEFLCFFVDSFYGSPTVPVDFCDEPGFRL